MLIASVILGCSCVPLAPELLAPVDNATDVPLAAQIAVLTVPGQRPLLLGDGINVAEEIRPDPFDEDLAVTILKPARALTANSAYRVVLGAGSLSLGQFTTAATPAPAPAPLAPTEVVLHAERLPAAPGYSCDSGGPDGVGIRVSQSGAANAAWFEIEFAVNGVVSAPAARRVADAFVFSSEACHRRGPSFDLGDEVCVTANARGIDGTLALGTRVCTTARACPSGEPCLSLPQWPRADDDGCSITAASGRRERRGSGQVLALIAFALLVGVAKVGAKRRAAQR